MLFLLRKIRQKLVSEQKIKSYLLYAVGEIILVVAGILIAVSLDNANNERKERQVELKYLDNLQSDLIKDEISLDTISQQRERVISSGLILFNTKKPETFDAYVALKEHLTRVIVWRAFVPSNNTFKELTSSGNLSIITNDSIKYGLMEMDRINSRIVNLRDHMRFEYNEFIYKKFFTSGEVADVFDFERFVTSSEMEMQSKDLLPEELIKGINKTFSVLIDDTFRNALKQTLINNRILIQYYRELNAEIEILTELINKEME